MKTLLPLLPLLAAAAAAAPVLDPAARWCDAVVAINEVSYHPADPDELGEWIELRNLMAVNIDLSGWSIAGGVDYAFAEGTILPGKGLLLVARDPAWLAAQGVGGTILGPFSGRLANGGELLELRDRNGRVMDCLEYGDRGKWPDAADGAGPTLARVAETTAGGDPGNWGWSTLAGGSPGQPNAALARHSPGPWRFDEASAAGDAAFFVELLNVSGAPLDPADWELRSPGRATIPLPAGAPVPPGGRLVLTSLNLGYTPLLDDLCSVVETATGAFADTVRLRDRAIGRAGADLRWRHTALATPGAGNIFPPQPRVVINEILYNASSRPAQQPVVEQQVVVPLTATWRYEQSGTNFSGVFAAESFNDSAWPSGPGCFYSLVGTPLAPPNSMAVPPLGTAMTAGRRMYYFRHAFTITGDPAGWEWRLRHLIDDGAIIYLNGQEIFRWHMPAGLPGSSTLANAAVSTANFDAHITVPASALKTGLNVLAVELRQFALTTANNDVFMGLDLIRERVTSPGVPYAEAPEEWIELHAPSGEPVDLSGWMIEGAVGYTFPAETVLPAGGHIVVARDPAALAARHPGLLPLGPWQGGLGNDNEEIRLTDANGNPADAVRYFDRAPWPDAADGGGSSLERIDPRAPGDLPAAWTASDESAKAQWQTVTWRGVAGVNDGPALWREFVCGLLEAGELQLDDVSVVENPDGTARQLVRNGGFEQGLEHWRARGTHKLSAVVPDPTQPGNHVLHLRASDGMEHEHNLIEATLAESAAVQAGTMYEISFRARWLGGSRQFHTRLYFNQLARTHVLPAPAAAGTPGQRNSRWSANAGPLARELFHHPVVPAPGQSVTVTALLEDPDGVAGATLWYRNEPSGQWQPLAMVPGPDGRHRASVAAGAAGQLTQFYVEAVDGPGAAASAPAAGPGSAALWQAADGRAATNGAGTLRLLAPAATWAAMEAATEVCSNAEVPLTLVIDESEAVYDCGMRFKSSLFGRSNMTNVGFNISLPAGRYFRGALKTVSLDRKGADRGYKLPDGTTAYGPAWQLREMLSKQIFNSAGGISTAYDDLVKLITTGTEGAEYAQLMLSRFTGNYLDNQYPNGGDGALFKQELVYYPLRTTLDNPADPDYSDRRVPSDFPEAPKIPSPAQVYYVHPGDLGPDPEQYRHALLVENNQDGDDFARVMEWSRHFGQPGPGTLAEWESIMDIDAWMRAYAATGLIGTFDNWLGSATPHNLMLYVRPDDGRVVPLMWDNDFFQTYNYALLRSTPLNEKILAHPLGERLYWGHLHDLLTRVATDAFIDYWGQHFADLLPNDSTWAVYRQYHKDRAAFCAAQLQASVPAVAFAITTNGGQDFTVATPYAVIEGTAWINVRSLRLRGREAQPAVTWTTRDTWSAAVTLLPGANVLEFEALDFRGGVLATRTITVTSTVQPAEDPRSWLRVSELFYNPPGDPAAEFVELVNTGTTAAPLASVRFTHGITVAFPADSPLVLAPGARALLVRDLAAFRAAFGPDLPVAGQFTGTALDNAGERLRFVYYDTVLSQDIAIQDFVYDDVWYPATDGGGYALVVNNELAPPADWSLAAQWRASWRRGGSPLAGDTEPPESYDWWRERSFTATEYASDAISGPLANPDGDALANWLEYAFCFDPKVGSPEHTLPVWSALQLADAIEFRVAFRRPQAATDLQYSVQESADMADWQARPWMPHSAVPDGEGRESVELRETVPQAELPRFLRLRAEPM